MTTVSVISVDDPASIAVAERVAATFEREVDYRYGRALLSRQAAPGARS